MKHPLGGVFTDSSKCNDAYGHIAGVADSDTGSRIFGARLANGIIVRPMGARTFGMTPQELDHAERGYRPLRRPELELVSDRCGVSVKYLQQGLVESAIETTADRYAKLHREYWRRQEELEAKQYDEDSPGLVEPYVAYLRRFKEVMTAAGHASINDAINARGWHPIAAWHEATGGTRLRLDQLIEYCKDLGGRPEYVALGTGAMMVDGSDPEETNNGTSRHGR